MPRGFPKSKDMSLAVAASSHPVEYVRMELAPKPSKRERDAQVAQEREEKLFGLAERLLSNPNLLETILAGVGGAVAFVPWSISLVSYSVPAEQRVGWTAILRSYEMILDVNYPAQIVGGMARVQGSIPVLGSFSFGFIGFPTRLTVTVSRVHDLPAPAGLPADVLTEARAKVAAEMGLMGMGLGVLSRYVLRALVHVAGQVPEAIRDLNPAKTS